MGTGDSRGGLYIDLENPNVLAGSEITGVVHLVVKEDTPAYGLQLCLKGRENTHWEVSNGNGGVIYNGKRKFLKWEIPLFVFSEGCLKPGHYSFPFAMFVPESLPGTFSFKAWENASAAIDYKLGAKIIGEKTEIEKTSIPLVISQTIYPLEEATRMENTAKMSTWCCLPQGEAKIKAETDKARYITGEIAATVLTAENQNSDLESKGFQVSLIRTIVLRDNSNNSKVITDIVSKTDSPHIIPTHHASPITKQLGLPIMAGSSQMSTVQGELVQCKYDIKCEVLMDSWFMCCSERPAVDKQVVICPSTIQRMQPPAVPEEWKSLVKTL